MNQFLRNFFRRKTKFIDRKQQTRFSIEFLLVMALFPLLIFALTLTPFLANFLLGHKAHMIQEDMIDLYILVRQIWWIIVIAIVFIVSLTIYMSHRIFGPIFRIKAIIRSKIEGEEIQVNKLRQGDYFVGLLDLVNELIDKYEGR